MGSSAEGISAIRFLAVLWYGEVGQGEGLSEHRGCSIASIISAEWVVGFSDIFDNKTKKSEPNSSPTEQLVQ